MRAPTDKEINHSNYLLTAKKKKKINVFPQVLVNWNKSFSEPKEFKFRDEIDPQRHITIDEKDQPKFYVQFLTMKNTYFNSSHRNRFTRFKNEVQRN